MWIWVLSFLCLSSEIFSSSSAVIIVPVADVVAHRLGSVEKYNNLAYCLNAPSESYGRLHQLLFNEQVRVLKEEGDEVKIEMQSAYYLDQQNRAIKTGWTLRKNLVFDKYLKTNRQRNAIPRNFSSSFDSADILTLSFPWHDPITKLCYSAGTRFVRNKQKDRSDSHAIWLINKSLKPIHTFVSKSCVVIGTPLSNENKIDNYIELIKFWINEGNKIQKDIAYVWGGTSFIKYYPDIFSQENNKEGVSVWTRPEKDIPYNGMDCSSLILRAAQICGIPYYLKNSKTILQTLDKVGLQDDIRKGDIIWYHGHVMIVSDVANNKVIESCGYHAGYGKVQELPLSKIFKNIRTYAQLKKTIDANEELIRLAKDGSDFKKIKAKVLKIRSLWNKRDCK